MRNGCPTVKYTSLLLPLAFSLSFSFINQHTRAQGVFKASRDQTMLSSGVLVSDAVLVSDGSFPGSGFILLSSGVLVSDGMLVSDGVLVSDAALVSDSNARQRLDRPSHVGNEWRPDARSERKR